MPMLATRSGSAMPVISKSHFQVSFPSRADRLDRGLGDLQVGLPIAATDADAADTFAVRQDRHAALHGGPALGTGGECESERVGHIEILADRSFRPGGALVRSRA